MSLGWVPLVFVAISVLAYWLLGRLMPVEEPLTNSISTSGSAWQQLRERCDASIQPLLPSSLKVWLDRRLSAAGYPWGLRSGSYLLLWIFVIVLGFFPYVLISSYDSIRLSGAIAWNLWLLLGAMPYIYLHRRGSKRQKLIKKSLPDLIDRLDITINVGLPFTTGMVKVLQYLPAGPLHDEFDQAMNEIQYGKSIDQAFMGIAQRVRVPEITSFISAVVQAQRLGVDISHVIRTQAESIRVQHRQHSEEEAAKAGTKLIFPLILVTLPMVFILLLGPILVSILVR